MIWSEYVLPTFGLPRITVEPHWTLALASSITGVVNLLHSVDATGLDYDGVYRTVTTCAIVTGALYSVAVLFGCQLLSANALAWALYVAWSWGPLESRDVRAFRSTKEFMIDSRGRPTFLALALLGSFVGCFVIPLDWDRPYQPFPIGSALVTSIVGPVGGLCLNFLRD